MSEHSFYVRRRRLSEKQEPVRFALVEARAGGESGAVAPLELMLVSGERLRIAAEVNTDSLRAVLGVLRADSPKGDLHAQSERGFDVDFL